MAERQRVLVCVVFAAALMALLCALNVARVAESRVSGEAYVRTFDNATAPLRATLATGDGQAYAALASDPTLARPDVFRGGAREAAYRAQRPLAVYAAWLLSAGRQTFVPMALLAIAIAGVALAAVSLAHCAHTRGATPMVAVAAGILPSSVAAARWIGPDPLAVGLVLAGVAAWPRHERRALVFFALAGLARETMLLAPMALALDAVTKGDIRRAVRGAATAVPWLVWVAVVRVRLGHWPFEAAGGRLTSPLQGVVDVTAGWTRPDVICAVLALAGTLIALRHWRDPMARVVLAFSAFALVMGTNVWLRWEDFARPLGPLYALALVLLLVPKTAGRNAANGAAHTALQ